MKKKINLMYLTLILSVVILVLTIVLSEILTGTISAIILVAGFLLFVIGIITAVYLEFSTGVYECQNCKHMFKPEFKAFMFSMHMGTTRKLKCPECGEKTWCKNRWNKN